MVDSGGRDLERLAGLQSMDMRDLDLLMALQSIGAGLGRVSTDLRQKKTRQDSLVEGVVDGLEADDPDLCLALVDATTALIGSGG